MINSFSLYINKFHYYLFKTIFNESKFMKMRKNKKKYFKMSINFINYFVVLRYQSLGYI
jgi:hypothetical protein